MNCKKNAKSRSDDEHRLFDPAVEKVVEIGLERLRPFENHPFKVKEDEAMARLMESIERYGIMNLLIVMPTRMMKKVSLMTTMRLILLPMPDLIMMSWNLWIPNIYQSTQVLSVTFIISANSHYIFIFLETIRSDSFISTSNLLQY